FHSCLSRCCPPIVYVFLLSLTQYCYHFRLRDVGRARLGCEVNERGGGGGGGGWWDSNPRKPSSRSDNQGSVSCLARRIARPIGRFKPPAASQENAYFLGNRNFESCLNPLRSRFRCFLSITTEYIIRRIKSPVWVSR